MIQARVAGTDLIMEIGDITEQNTEAIVNAANSSLLGGRGVDGAIHQAGGPQILKECKEIRQKQGQCPPGEAVLTSGGNLKADYVIHTVGAVWNGGKDNESEVLENAYHNSLRLASNKKIKSISFPSISTGAFGYPVEKAAEVALSTIKNFAKDYDLPKKIKMILFSEQDFNTYINIWEDYIINN